MKDLHKDILECKLNSFKSHVKRMLELEWLNVEAISKLRKWIGRNRKLEKQLDEWEKVLEHASCDIRKTTVQQVSFHDQVWLLHFFIVHR